MNLIRNSILLALFFIFSQNVNGQSGRYLLECHDCTSLRNIPCEPCYGKANETVFSGLEIKTPSGRHVALIMKPFKIERKGTIYYVTGAGSAEPRKIYYSQVISFNGYNIATPAALTDSLTECAKVLGAGGGGGSPGIDSTWANANTTSDGPRSHEVGAGLFEISNTTNPANDIEIAHNGTSSNAQFRFSDGLTYLHHGDNQLQLAPSYTGLWYNPVGFASHGFTTNLTDAQMFFNGPLATAVDDGLFQGSVNGWEWHFPDAGDLRLEGSSDAAAGDTLDVFTSRGPTYPPTWMSAAELGIGGGLWVTDANGINSNSQNVGVNTTSDAVAKLKVDGKTIVGSAAPAVTSDALLMVKSPGSLFHGFAVENNNAAGWNFIGRNEENSNAVLFGGGSATGGVFDARPANVPGGLIVKHDGKVGISTTSPSQMFHVVGNARITGAVYDSNNEAGTSGQILSSTITGTDWIDAGGSSPFTSTGNYIYQTTLTDSIGIGTATPGELVELRGFGNTRTRMKVINKDAGASAGASMLLEGSVARTFLSSHNTGVTGVRFGKTLAGYSELAHFDGSGMILGTHNASPLLFGTSNTERMRIQSDGKVGIATAAPSQVLHVVGNARVTGAVYDSNNEAGTSGQILSSTVTGTDWIDASGGSSPFTSTGNYIYQTTLTDSVGIGIATPSNLFHIHNATAPVLQLTNTTTGTAVGDGLQIDQTGLNASIINKEAGTMSLGTSNSTDMTIDAAGDVGIGTTNPLNPLHVSGNAIIDGDLSFNTAQSYRIYFDGVDDLNFRTDGLNAKLRKITTGSAQMLIRQNGTGTTADDLPVYAELDDADTGMYFDGADAVGLSTGGVGRVIVSNTTVNITTSDITIDAANDVRVVTGTGTPEGAVTAGVGSSYHREDGGAGTTLYIKESGAGNTGWVAMVSGAPTASYGSMTFAGASETITATGAGTYDVITNGTANLFSTTLDAGDVTVDGDSMVVSTNAAIYEITVSLSLSAGNASHYNFHILKAGSPILTAGTARDMAGTEAGSVTYKFLYSVAAGDSFTVSFEETAGTTDPTFYAGSMVMVKID